MTFSLLNFSLMLVQVTMASQSSNDDCYFYFYSSCTKGDECPFRHCQLALGTETVCSLWKEGRCTRTNCKFRHMESRINRSTIPCYWENQPGGCRKPHCVFLHRKIRNGIQSVKSSPKLIRPDGKSSPKIPDLKDQASPTPEALPESKPDDYVPDPSSVPVQPLVLNFDEGEESDTESVSSTPVKVMNNETKCGASNSAKNNLSTAFSGSSGNKDFGIKTLEQIRMEKIHKESDKYYTTDDTSGKGIPNLTHDICHPTESILSYPGFDIPSLDVSLSMDKISKEYYPPQSEFLSLPVTPSLDKSLSVPIKEVSRHNLEKENDLRKRLTLRSILISDKANSEMKSIAVKPQKIKKEEIIDSLNFKVKTLEEIRKERENKKRGYQEYCSHSDEKQAKVEGSKEDESERPVKKVKITRKSKELSNNSITVGKDTSVLKSDKDPNPEVLLNWAEKSTGEFNHLNNQITSGVQLCAEGKRKSTFAELEVPNKVSKIVIRNAQEFGKPEAQPGAKQKQVVKNLALFLRHSKTKPALFTPDSSSSTSEIPTTTPETLHIPSHTTENETDAMLPPVHKPEIKFDTAMPLPNSIPETENLLPTDTALSPQEDVFSTNVKTIDELTDAKSAKEVNRSVSVDEFDRFLAEESVNVDGEEGSIDANDDILLEVEQFLDS